MNRSLFRILPLTLLATFICLPASATMHRTEAHRAEVQVDPLAGRNAYMGLMPGLSSGNKNAGSGFGYSVDAGYFFTDTMGAGVFLQGGDHSFGISSFFMGAEFLYRLNDLLPGLQVGGILAEGKISAGPPYPAGTFPGNYNIGLGFKAAYDHPVNLDRLPLTVGAQLSFIFIKPGTETLTFASPMLTAKYWF